MEREKVCVCVCEKDNAVLMFHFFLFIFIIFQGSWENGIFQATLGICGPKWLCSEKGVSPVTSWPSFRLPSAVFTFCSFYFLLAPCRESKGVCWSAGDWALTGLKELQSPPKRCPTPPVTLTASINRNKLGAKLCLWLHWDVEIILTAVSIP